MRASELQTKASINITKPTTNNQLLSSQACNSRCYLQHCHAPSTMLLQVRCTRGVLLSPPFGSAAMVVPGFEKPTAGCDLRPKAAPSQWMMPLENGLSYLFVT